MTKLSIVISAYNEQKKIRTCLDSVKWADEIIFIDNSSTDKTVKIAREYTKKIYIQKNEPTKIDLQKNLGIQKATGDWIFVLDADETITPELAKELQELMKRDEVVSNGFWVPRKISKTVANKLFSIAFPNALISCERREKEGKVIRIILSIINRSGVYAHFCAKPI